MNMGGSSLAREWRSVHDVDSDKLMAESGDWVAAKPDHLAHER